MLIPMALDVHVSFDIVIIGGKNPKSRFKSAVILSIGFFICVIYNKLFNYLLFSRWIYVHI